MELNLKRYVPAIAILFLVGVSAIASIGAQQVSIPVILDKAEVLPPVGGGESGGLGLVSVTFTDRATIAAKEVVLDVLDDQGGFIARIRDYGLFSPGVAISHRFYIGNIGANPRDSVEIGSVTLADGTVRNSTPIRPMPRMQQRVGYEVQMMPARR